MSKRRKTTPARTIPAIVVFILIVGYFMGFFTGALIFSS